MISTSNQVLFLILATGGLLSCTDHQTDPVIVNEINTLTSMVNELSGQLTALGFPLSPQKINIDVKSPIEMAAIYNQISDESRHDVKSYTPFGPLYRDGANARLAFYDPNSKTIIFRQGASSEMSTGYLAHELIHVYQDQKWGFDTIWQPYQANPSREIFNITQYIIEGHAELGRQAYQQAYAKDQSAIHNLSMSLGKIVEDECVACNSDRSIANLPYYMGMRYLAHRYQAGRWSEVEDNLLNLPTSSEQILHPDKLNSDLPSNVDLPVWRDEEIPAQLIFNGPMGEAFLLNKMMSFVSAIEAYTDASGWDGDRAHFYRTDDGREALVWRIVFDRELDARQLELSLKTANMARDNMRSGKTIDWVISDSAEMKNKLRIFMSKHSFITPRINIDEQSTTKQESLDLNDNTIFYPKARSKIMIGPNRS